MSSLKILLGSATMPDSKSFIPLFIDNLLYALKSKMDVNIVWLIYKPEKLEIPFPTYPDTTILDIHNYENALQVLKEEKPDMIFASASWDLMDYALSSAGKFLDIPVASPFMIESIFDQDMTEKLASYAKRFFENSTPTDTIQSKKQFMKRGRFFIYKYVFLLKTQFAIHHSILQLISSFFLILKKIVDDYRPVPDSRFSNTVHWLQSENLIKQLVDVGFDKSSLIITGNPMFDAAFQKIQRWKSKPKEDHKIRVLFAPSTLYEHGLWTRQQRDDSIKQIIKELTNNDKISLKVKIHPSSANLSEYESLVHTIDKNIKIHQQGDILDLLYDADVVITFGFTFVNTYALISKKPIIICNFFNGNKDDFVQKGIALECISSTSLVKTINQALSKNLEYEQRCDEYIKNFFYKSDGLAAERISDSIVELIKNNPK